MANYTSPEWVNDSAPKLNATNMQALTDTVERSQILYGSGAPTSSTAGNVGQRYVNTANLKQYICRAAGQGTYTWAEDTTSGGKGAVVVDYFDSAQTAGQKWNTIQDAMGTNGRPTTDIICNYGNITCQYAWSKQTSTSYQEWDEDQQMWIDYFVFTDHFVFVGWDEGTTAASVVDIFRVDDQGQPGYQYGQTYSITPLTNVQRGLITLSAASWTGSASPYSQTATVVGATVTDNSMINLQPSASQFAALKTDGVTTMLVENDDGVITVYSLGNTPSGNITLQCTVTETV